MTSHYTQLIAAVLLCVGCSAQVLAVTMTETYREDDDDFSWRLSWDAKADISSFNLQPKKDGKKLSDKWEPKISLFINNDTQTTEVFLDAAHDIAVPGHRLEDARGDLFSTGARALKVEEATRNFRLRTYGEVAHPKSPDRHIDAYRLAIRKSDPVEFPSVFEASYSGAHLQRGLKSKWSLTPDKSGRATVTTMFPGRPDLPATVTTTDSAGVKVSKDATDIAVEAGVRIEGVLPTRGNMHPNAYTVFFDDPGRKTNVTLFFMTGLPGSFDKGSLDVGIQFFAGLNEFEVPLLISEQDDLFIGVDLARWLSDPIELVPFQEFLIEDGVHESLPGFLVGTSEVLLDSAIGLITEQPFTGPTESRAIIDGSVAVPEPIIILLVAIGLLWIVVARKPRASLGQCSE